MKFAVDRIEENIVVLENLDTQEILEMSLTSFNFKVSEKDILIYEGGLFHSSEEETRKREELIKNKLERLRNL